METQEKLSEGEEEIEKGNGKNLKEGELKNQALGQDLAKRCTEIADLILFAGFCRRQNAINCHSFRPNSCSQGSGRKRGKKYLKEKNYFFKMENKKHTFTLLCPINESSGAGKRLNKLTPVAHRGEEQLQRFWIPTSPHKFLLISFIINIYLLFLPYLFSQPPLLHFTCTLSFSLINKKDVFFLSGKEKNRQQVSKARRNCLGEKKIYNCCSR
uniref:Uncharacterized protein n=1 Tax=Oryza brachyantha TaxID=4533 RepID=J3MUC8_ORYBR